MHNPSPPITELAAFHLFVGERLLQQGFAELSPEQSVEEFRAYQRDLERLKEELGPAIEQIRQGQASEIDIEEFIAEGRERLAEKGVTD
jgi:hypothetical protein